MKKTLITLMALAASAVVASAAVERTEYDIIYKASDFQGGVLTIPGLDSMDSWTLDMRFDLRELEDYTSKTLLFAFGYDAENPESGVPGIQAYIQDSTLYYVFRGNVAEEYTRALTTDYALMDITFEYRLEDDNAEFYFTDKGISENFESILPVTYEREIPDPKLLVSFNEIHSDGIGSAGYIHVTGSIPEPATATLSLIALAGLAARRRRK